MSTPPDPEPKGAVYLLDSSDLSLQTLPDESWKMVHSSGFKAAWGSKHVAAINLEISGARSPFRITPDKAGFVFTFDSPEDVALYASTDDKNNRQFPIETINTNNRNIARLPSVPVDVTQFGKSSYKLVPRSPLAPGEYVILLRGSPQAKEHKAFTFGVAQ